jgi:hypothetical protein
LTASASHLVARFGPLVQLGVPPKVIAVLMVMNITRSVFPHLNADVRCGRLLNLIFSTPEVHSWHHLQDPTLAQVNFGDTTNIWDHVFRTYQRPGVTRVPGWTWPRPTASPTTGSSSCCPRGACRDRPTSPPPTEPTEPASRHPPGDPRGTAA